VLATILEEEGYAVDTARNGREAIKKTSTRFYNLALIDIRLTDMEGTKLLAKIKDTIPKMRKIMITGYPSMQNAIEALNKGAHAYILKPLDMEKVIETINKQLKEQKKEKKYSQEKVTEFIETRVKELEEKPLSHEK
jgi:DNA-binding NtrC family response regulator